MTQLPYIEPEAADALTTDMYDKAEAHFDMALNIFTITGNAPEIAEKMWKISTPSLMIGYVGATGSVADPVCFQQAPAKAFA